MTVLGGAALTAGWLATGELVRRRLERVTGARRGPLTIACWPLAVAGEALLYGLVRGLGGRDGPGDGLPAAPLGWRALKDDGGWLHPEEPRLLARAECEQTGHLPVVTMAKAGAVRCARCGERDPSTRPPDPPIPGA